MLRAHSGVYRVPEGRACWGGQRHSTQDKWITQFAKFSVAGAQRTCGGGRAARAAIEAGRKAWKSSCLQPLPVGLTLPAEPPNPDPPNRPNGSMIPMSLSLPIQFPSPAK